MSAKTSPIGTRSAQELDPAHRDICIIETDYWILINSMSKTSMPEGAPGRGLVP